MEPEQQQQQQEADDEPQQQFSSAILDNYTVTPGPGAEIQSYTTFQQPMVPIPEAAEAAGGGSAGGQSDSAAAGGSDRGRTGSVQSGACKAAVPLSELLVPNDDDPDLYDPNCDPDKPQIVRFQDVSAAAFKIRSGIVRTPCDRSHMSRITNMEIFFKKEFLQYTGSFKERGARYVLLSLSKEQKQRGVVAASAGNHALALAYHGQELGIPIVVVMPTIAPLMKINACVQCGARVIVMGSHIGESKNVALKIAKSEGLLYVNGYDHPQILAGQGTVGLEILEQIGKPVDAIVLPVGGGGLIAGVAVGVKTMSPDTLIIRGRRPRRWQHRHGLSSAGSSSAAWPWTGRLIHFVATCSSLLAGMGVSIKDIFHERAWLKYDIFQLPCASVRDREHGEELLAKLKEHYGPGSGEADLTAAGSKCDEELR
uniref:Serine racemase n=1 Tax=Macrostomum lignano TaxID=282301 RepID=A0A1I8HNK2_9PLAT